MLLSDIVLLMNVTLQGGEDIAFLHDTLSTPVLNLKKRLVGNAVLVGRSVAILWGDSEVLKFFSEYDNGLLVEEWVLRS